MKNANCRPVRLLITLGLLSTLTLTPAILHAASAAELLEQARAKSRDLEELKSVLNGPDANMRLATFEVMAGSGDPVMRELAIDAALTGTDAVLQALALKSVILAQSSLRLSLTVDTSQPEDIQAKARAYLEKKGNLYTQKITAVDPENAVFKMQQYEGQVSGSTVSFVNSYDKGTLYLEDETTLKGPVTLYQGGYGGFIATWTFR